MAHHSWLETDPTTGRFRRKSQPWSPDRFEDGHVNNKGRFIVYRPDYPRAWPGGRALRTHVLWWLQTSEAVPKGYNLHHINGDRLDDRIDNLELVRHGEHSRQHQRARRTPDLWRVCQRCGKEFAVTFPRRARKFCSQKCYHSHPKASRKLEKSCAYCGTPMLLTGSQARKRKFCSQRCSALARWRGSP